MVPKRTHILVLLLAALAAAVPTPVGASDTRSVSGPFTSSLLTPPMCTSPVGICTLGHLTGDLDATYFFTIQTILPDPSHPAVLAYAGDSVITILRGGAQMFSHDTGLMDTTDPTTVPFLTTVHVYAGTKQYKDATGTLLAPGTLNFLTGRAVGTYSGSIDK